MKNDNRYMKQGQQGEFDHQYGFDHYDLPSGRRGLVETVLGDSMAARIRSPLFATVALLVTGAAFAGIIIASYPDNPKQNENIPVVKADAGAYRETPADAGGMDIPNRDTTIFSTMNDENVQEKPPVENLLAGEPPVDRLNAFARQVEVEEASSSSEDVRQEAGVGLEMPATAEVPASSRPVEFKRIVAAEAGEAEDAAVAEVAAAIKSDNKAETAAVASAPASTAAAMPSSDALAKPVVMHKPGENPETLEYVRSALNEGAGKTEGVGSAAAAAVSAPASGGGAVSGAGAQEEVVSKIEPASGLAVTAGDYYIQLGSVSSQSGASGEWNKLKASYSAELGALSYRVQEANLGERGTFYRIQAGPISKDSATRLCDSIKMRKPGACLVTK